MLKYVNVGFCRYKQFVEVLSATQIYLYISQHATEPIVGPLSTNCIVARLDRFAFVCLDRQIVKQNVHFSSVVFFSHVSCHASHLEVAMFHPFSRVRPGIFLGAAFGPASVFLSRNKTIAEPRHNFPGITSKC